MDLTDVMIRVLERQKDLVEDADMEESLKAVHYDNIESEMSVIYSLMDRREKIIEKLGKYGL